MATSDPNETVENPTGAAAGAGKVAGLREIGGFELIQKIGQGGMGAVFKARQKSLDRVVALKVLPPSIAKNKRLIERFQREARASAKLAHPNIVQGIDVGQDPATGLWYFAMEFVDGPTLKQLLKEQRVLPEVRALEIARDVARALECIESSGMVHRDVKPDNLLLSNGRDVKLADLGLAKEIEDDASLTQAGSAIGTPYYMAPEQVKGLLDEIDVRTDVYALGGTLFHLVTGKPPFDGQTSAVVLSKQLTETPPKARAVNPEVSEACSSLIFRMMSKKREQRPRPAELLAQIKALLSSDTEGTTGPCSAVRGATTGPRAPIRAGTTGFRTAVRNATTGVRPPVHSGKTGIRPAVHGAISGVRAPVSSNISGARPPVIGIPKAPPPRKPPVVLMAGGGVVAVSLLLLAVLGAGGRTEPPKEKERLATAAPPPRPPEPVVTRPLDVPPPVEKKPEVREPEPVKESKPPEPVVPPAITERPPEPKEAPKPEPVTDLAAARIAYAKYFDEFLTLLSQGDTKNAEAKLEQAEIAEVLKPLKEQLAQDRKALKWLAEAGQAMADGARKLAALPDCELRLAKGAPVKLGGKSGMQIAEVKDGTIYVGSQGVSMPLAFAKLHFVTQRRLMELAWNEKGEDLVKFAFVCALHLKDGKDKEPVSIASIREWVGKAQNANAPTEDVAFVRRVLEHMEKAAAECAAQLAWDEIPPLAAAKQWKALVAAIEKFKAAHGATAFAASKTDEIAALLKLAAQSSLPLTGLTLWLRADAGVVVQNNAVTQWQDQSGQNHHAVTADPGKGPAVVPEGCHGRPALRFDGVDDGFTVPGVAGEMESFTILWTLKPVSLKNWNQAIAAAGSWGQFVFHTTSDGGVFVGTSVPARISPGDGPHGGTVVKDTWQQFAYVLDRGKASFYKDGKLLASKQLTPAKWTGFQLGGYSGGNTIDGEMSELLIYERALTDDERKTVEKHLLRGAKADVPGREPF